MRAIPDEYRECNAVSNVLNEFSVWGEEFVNFIAATLTCRILRRAEKAKLLDKMTFSEMLEDLEQSWRPVKDAEVNAIPDSTDGKWVNTTIGTMEMLSALGLVKSPINLSIRSPAGRESRSWSLWDRNARAGVPVKLHRPPALLRRLPKRL